jgi:hypothetical protein
MPDPIRILEAMGLATLIAGIFALSFGLPWRAPNPARARIGGVLGLAAGILSGCWRMDALPNWPPREDHDRLLLFLLPLVAAVEIVIAVTSRPLWLPRLLRLIVVAGAAPVLLYGSSYIAELTGPGSREWTISQMVVIFAGLAFLLAIVWWAMWLLTKRSACRSVPILLALVSTGATVTILLSGYASAGQSGLNLPAALVGVTVASLVLKGPPQMNGVIGVGLVVLFALLVEGRFFGQLSTTHALLLMGAPLLAWCAEIPSLRRRSSLAHRCVRVILPMIPVTFALILAQRQFVADSGKTAVQSSEPSADDYLNFGK